MAETLGHDIQQELVNAIGGRGAANLDGRSTAELFLLKRRAFRHETK